MNALLHMFAAYADTYFLTAARLFCFLLCVPGFGDLQVPRRIRFLMAVAICFVVVPLLNVQAVFSFSMLFQECLLGFFVGTLVRLFFDSFVMAGALISQQTSFGNTMRAALSHEVRDVFSVFCHLYFITLFFCYDLHLLLIRGLCDSYHVLPLGHNFWEMDFLESLTHILTKGMKAAFSLTIPFWVMGIFYYVILGLLNRLVPMMPVFFVGQPFVIFGVLLMMILCLSRFAYLFSSLWTDFLYRLFLT